MGRGPRPFPAKVSETSLHMSVERFLRHAWPGHLPYTHFPAGGLRDKATAGKLRAMGLRSGWADLQFILPNGQAAFIELKTTAGQLSPEQIELRRKLVALKCGYAVCRSVEEVEATLARWLAMFGLSLRAHLSTPAPLLKEAS